MSMEADIGSPSVGVKNKVKSIKGVHDVREATSTAASGVQRVGIYFPGVWRFKGITVKNPNSAVLEPSRLMVQFGGGNTFNANRPWFPLSTGECDDTLEHWYDPDDKILRFATVYAEVTHGSAISHTLSVVADKIGEGDEGLEGSPKPVEYRRPSLLGRAVR